MAEVIERLRRVEQLQQFDSATIANAIEHFAVRDPTCGYASNELSCQTLEIKAQLVGYAFTCTVDTTTPGDIRPPRVDELVGEIEKAERPSVLVAQYSGPDRSRSCVFGDMFCTILDKLGCVGLVTDANGRDLDGIRQRTPDFHVFCAGWVVSHGYPAYIEFGTEVTVCGLAVRPGDLLHGDANGLVTVPLEIADEVCGRARAVCDEEQEYFDFLQGGDFNMEELKQRINPRQ